MVVETMSSETVCPASRIQAGRKTPLALAPVTNVSRTPLERRGNTDASGWWRNQERRA